MEWLHVSLEEVKNFFASGLFVYVATGVLKKAVPLFQRQDAGRKARVTALAMALSAGTVALKNFIDGSDDVSGVRDFAVAVAEAVGVWLMATGQHTAAKPTKQLDEHVVTARGGSLHVEKE